MRSPRIAVAVLVVVVVFVSAYGQQNEPTAPADTNLASPPAAPTSAAGPFDEVIRKVVERERYFNGQIRILRPLIETYIQNLKDDDEMGPQPTSDQYFLSRLNIAGDKDDRFVSSRPHKL